MFLFVFESNTLLCSNFITRIIYSLELLMFIVRDVIEFMEYIHNLSIFCEQVNLTIAIFRKFLRVCIYITKILISIGVLLQHREV